MIAESRGTAETPSPEPAAVFPEHAAVIAALEEYTDHGRNAAISMGWRRYLAKLRAGSNAVAAAHTVLWLVNAHLKACDEARVQRSAVGDRPVHVAYMAKCRIRGELHFKWSDAVVNHAAHAKAALYALAQGSAPDNLSGRLPGIYVRPGRDNLGHLEPPAPEIPDGFGHLELLSQAVTQFESVTAARHEYEARFGCTCGGDVVGDLHHTHHIPAPEISHAEDLEVEIDSFTGRVAAYADTIVYTIVTDLRDLVYSGVQS